VDFFRRLAPVNLRDGLSPSYLDIGGSMSVTILEKVLEFIYLEHCFVDKTEVLTGRSDTWANQSALIHRTA